MKWIYSILAVGFLTSCAPPECADFRTGTFAYADTTFKDIKITRTSDQQIETSSADNYRDVYHVIWTDDCHYRLILQETNNKERMPFTNLDTMNVFISDFTKKGYVFE